MKIRQVIGYAILLEIICLLITKFFGVPGLAVFCGVLLGILLISE